MANAHQPLIISYFFGKWSNFGDVVFALIPLPSETYFSMGFLSAKCLFPLGTEDNFSRGENSGGYISVWEKHGRRTNTTWKFSQYKVNKTPQFSYHQTIKKHVQPTPQTTSGLLHEIFGTHIPIHQPWKPMYIATTVSIKKRAPLKTKMDQKILPWKFAPPLKKESV